MLTITYTYDYTSMLFCSEVIQDSNNVLPFNCSRKEEFLLAGRGELCFYLYKCSAFFSLSSVQCH